MKESDDEGPYPISVAIGKARTSISSLWVSCSHLLKEYNSIYLVLVLRGLEGI